MCSKPRVVGLGPFELHEPVARGGMGEVWRATHRDQKIPVAVKVMLGERARDPAYVTGFENEVRAVASMQHPHIVRVFEYGTIPLQAEEASDGALVAGSPYLAMEWAQGSLAPLVGNVSWTRLRAILLALLDALAHAHARRIVHRDIKPDNILLCGEEGIVRPKLADFGIARLLDGAATPSGTLSGTPHYMAPEQFHADDQKLGAWTDLYALACVAYRLATGDPPFEASSLVEMCIRHETEEFPELGGRSGAYPEAFVAWMRRAAAKAPEDRFQCAADAAWALRKIEDEADAELDGSPAELTSEDEATLVLSHIDTAPLSLWDTLDYAGDTIEAETALASSRRGSAAKTFAAVERPPIALTPPDNEAFDPRPLQGVGLGLFGLRPVPLVDRETERAVLWNALRQVDQEQAPRVVVLRGGAGSGKSRLARWLCLRAEELGAATSLRVAHEKGAAQAMGRAIRGWLRCAGSEFSHVLEASRRHLELHMEAGPARDYEARALATLAAAPGDARALEFRDAPERFNVFFRFVRRLSSSRPLIVWFDDIHWSSDSIEQVRYVLERSQKHPVALHAVLTVRDDLLADLSAAAGSLAALERESRVRKVELAPLGSEDHQALVRGLLGLEDELVDAICARTEGNPLFAVQLVADWVERGMLEAGPTGFRLTEGAPARLPDDLHALWSERLRRLTEADAAQLEAFEIAAALGVEIVSDEWRDACRRRGLEPGARLVQRLLDRGLAVGTPQRWSFVHGMLRESLNRQSEEAGRLSSIHRCCAETLLARHPPGTKGISERVGRHWRAGARPERAVDYLLDAAREREEISDYARALELVAQASSSLQEADAPEDDPRRGECMMIESRVRSLSSIDAGWNIARAALEQARRHAWRGVEARALEQMGRIERKRLHLEEAVELFEEAVRIFDALGDRRGYASCLQQLGVCAMARGASDRAQTLLVAASQAADVSGDRRTQAWCENGLGDLARRGGDLAEAGRRYARALALFEATGNTYGMLWCVHDLAQVDRERGELEGAQQGYMRALALADALSQELVAPRINLGLAQIEAQRFVEAKATLSTALALASDRGMIGERAMAQLCMLPCLVVLREWHVFDRFLEESIEVLSEAQLHDPDLAAMLQLAGELALQAGARPRAARALRSAESEWRILGMDDEAAAVAKLLSFDVP